MFPAQTSLIPVTIALVKYIENHGFLDNYPYWYLGSTPVKYLIGPSVPTILIGLHKILLAASLFDLSILFLVTCFLFQAAGWGMLISRLSGKRMVGWLVSILVFIMPWHWISGLALSELSAAVAEVLTPWVLLAFLFRLSSPPAETVRPNTSQDRFAITGLTYASARQHFRSKSDPNSGLASSYFLRRLPSPHSYWWQGYTLTVCLFALLLLTNSVASIPTIVGLVILGILKKGDGLRRVAIIVFVGWLISTLWYGPGYWLTIWQAPSISGRSAFLALGWIVDMARSLGPFILAIAVVLWGVKAQDRYQKFAWYWFGTFAILTFIRFIADWRFWADWTAWIGEVEVGIALLLARNFQFKKFNFGVWSLVIGVLLIVAWFWAYQARGFWLPRKNIANTVEFRIAKWLDGEINNAQGPVSSSSQPTSSADSNSNLSPSRRSDLRALAGTPSATATLRSDDHPAVFLSGTTAFWLNAFYDIRQVRGGVDQASKNQQWRQATWELRQGSDPLKSQQWLQMLKVKYIVVHTAKSAEFYHDFANPEKFKNIQILQRIYDQDGDMIYEISN